MPYGVRVLFCAIMAATSFLLVSFSSAVWMSILGVIFASISSGLGELLFFSSYFFLLVYPPSLPQWRTKETEYAALVSEDRQQLLDSSDDEEPESSTTGKCHIRRV
ncbi:unnamed protein product [Oreochromis niloticus]|nr:unnamed protein product [Mustela putorius furo]